jgi:hypothetical protein
MTALADRDWRSGRGRSQAHAIENGPPFDSAPFDAVVILFYTIQPSTWLAEASVENARFRACRFAMTVLSRRPRIKKNTHIPP